MSVKLELKADQLIKDFDRLTGEVQQAMIDELRVTGFMIESAYKIGVPVDTGRLRSSIHTETANKRAHSYSNNKGETFVSRFSFEKLQKTQVVVGTNVIYANKIEYQGGKTKGKGALLTAFEAETKGLPQRLAELIK